MKMLFCILMASATVGFAQDQADIGTRDIAIKSIEESRNYEFARKLANKYIRNTPYRAKTLKEIDALEASAKAEKEAYLAAEKSLNERLKKQGIAREDYDKMILVVALFSKGNLTGDQMAKANVAARQYGVVGQDGTVNAAELAYLRALCLGADPEKAMAAKNSALLAEQTQLLREQNQLTRDQLNEQVSWQRQLQIQRPDLFGAPQRQYPVY